MVRLKTLPKCLLHWVLISDLSAWKSMCWTLSHSDSLSSLILANAVHYNRPTCLRQVFRIRSECPKIITVSFFVRYSSLNMAIILDLLCPLHKIMLITVYYVTISKSKYITQNREFIISYNDSLYHTVLSYSCCTGLCGSSLAHGANQNWVV